MDRNIMTACVKYDYTSTLYLRAECFFFAEVFFRSRAFRLCDHGLKLWQRVNVRSDNNDDDDDWR